MDELIAYLRNNTHLGRLSAPEIRELIARMDEDGWEIVRKSDGVIVEPEPEPIPEPEPTGFHKLAVVESEGYTPSYD